MRERIELIGGGKKNERRQHIEVGGGGEGGGGWVRRRWSRGFIMHEGKNIGTCSNVLFLDFDQ